MSEEKAVSVIYQIVDSQGKRVFDENDWTMYQIVDDHEHIGLRGNTFDLYQIAGRLHFDHNRVILNTTGDQVSRAALMEAAGDTLSLRVKAKEKER